MTLARSSSSIRHLRPAPFNPIDLLCLLRQARRLAWLWKRWKSGASAEQVASGHAQHINFDQSSHSIREHVLTAFWRLIATFLLVELGKHTIPVQRIQQSQYRQASHVQHWLRRIFHEIARWHVLSEWDVPAIDPHLPDKAFSSCY